MVKWSNLELCTWKANTVYNLLDIFITNWEMTVIAHKIKIKSCYMKQQLLNLCVDCHMIFCLTTLLSFHRGITLVCLKCDFLADTSGLDRMAKHLNQRKTHSCQVVIENGMYMCLLLWIYDVHEPVIWIDYSVSSYKLNWYSVFVCYIYKHKAFSDFSYWKNFWIHFWVSLFSFSTIYFDRF